jgi:hypothetical protein
VAGWDSTLVVPAPGVEKPPPKTCFPFVQRTTALAVPPADTVAKAVSCSHPEIPGAPAGPRGPAGPGSPCGPAGPGSPVAPAGRDNGAPET